jgi:5-methylcytosine-specific restriction endonuclease McrA
MALITFEKAHNFLDTLGIPRLDEYESNVIIDRIDFTEQENDGSLEWREDGVYIKVKGHHQRGFMFNKDYKVSDYGNPRFHLFECSVIQKFIDKGIMSRYYFWSNSDLVTVTQRGSSIEYENQSLNLCSKCRQILHERNLPNITNTEGFHNLLDLNDNEIENNETEVETDIFKRPINWRRISRAYREEQNYTCEECGFGGEDLENNYDKRYIHTHHINSNELLNTHRDNLKAVCILCHYKQDEHHQSNFEKRRMKRELISFVTKYRNRLIEIGNLYVEEYIRENEI